MAKISILGSGGWGIALSVMADHYNHEVKLFSVFEDEVNQLKRDRENTKLLSGIKIKESIQITSDINDLKDSEIFILAVPSFAIRSTAKLLNEIYTEQTIVCVSKGLEAKTLKRLSVVIGEEIESQRIVVLSGPSHAEEVSKGLPTTLVAASENINAAEYIQNTLMNPTFRIYTNPDIIGVELGGTVKNLIALAAGICDGLGFGDNTKAALITRGISEISRLGVAMGAKNETFMGLSGIGDLIVTCTSMHSRNRRAGILIGKGVPIEQAIEQVGTVEGYHAVANVHSLAMRYGVEMPISQQCWNVCYENIQPISAVSKLMERPTKNEQEEVIKNKY